MLGTDADENDHPEHGEAAESFATLLGRLVSAHERELSEGLSRLRLENAALRAAIRTSPKQPPSCEPPPLVSEGPSGSAECGAPGACSSQRSLSFASANPAPEVPPAVRFKDEQVLPIASKSKTEGGSCDGQSWSVRVRMLGATGLSHADWTILGSNAPTAYCVCEVLGKPYTRVRTEVAPVTADPEWDTEVVIADFRETDVLVFTVYDEAPEDELSQKDDTVMSDQLLGQVQVEGGKVFEAGIDGELQLREVGEGISSNLRIRLAVEPTRPPQGLAAQRFSSKSASMISADDASGAPLPEFSMREVWSAPISPQSRYTSRRNSGSCTPSKVSTKELMMDSSRQEIITHNSSGFVRHLISPPGSPYRLAWDLMGAILIVYDSLAIPLQVFDLPHSTFTFAVDCFTLVFWTSNIFTSMTVGYFRNGVVEMRLSKIMNNYLRTWFFVDVAVVVPDWYFSSQTLSTLGEEQSGAGNSVRLLRIVRLVRSVRLIRLLKLRWILAALNDLLNSESASIIANIFKMISMLLFINHFIACIWFAISDMKGSHDTWLYVHDLKDSSWDYQYLTSLHWSITQFTPASMHVQPQNSMERTFAITVVVFALVGFSYLVGSITNSLSQLRSMSEDHSKQFWTLRRYLKQHAVPTTLNIRIQRYLEHAWQRQKAGVSEPTLLQLLSEQLLNELQCARSIPHMVVHPLFDHLNDISDVTVQRLAVKAISRRNLARGDRLFFPGETATHVYFVVVGQLQYMREDWSGQKYTELVESHEDWISEPVLWTPSWIHLGTLQAITEAELLLVEGGKFGDIISLTPMVHAVVKHYAKRFLQWVNQTKREDLSDISQGEDISNHLRTFIDGRGGQHSLQGHSRAGTGSPAIQSERLDRFQRAVTRTLTWKTSSTNATGTMPAA